MKKIWAYMPFLILMACSGKDEKAGADSGQPQTQAPLAKSQNSEVFNASFQKLLNDYFNLKDGLVKSKDNTIDASVNTSAAALTASADSLQLKELKADTTLVGLAKSTAEGISAEAKALTAEPALEDKRKSFQMISDQLYDLVRTVRYDRQIVYHSFCPMAFNNQGAYWLDKTSEIKNPYFGAKMLDCGEVKDSLDFVPKQK